MILSEATHYINSESYAFECEKLSFWSWKAMLSDAGSYAFGLLELCFWMLGAMLSDHGSNAFGTREQCSGPYGACLYIPSTYGAMLCRVGSSAFTGDK